MCVRSQHFQAYRSSQHTTHASMPTLLLLSESTRLSPVCFVSSLLLPQLPCRAHLASKLCHLWFRGYANVAHIYVAFFCCTDFGCLQRHIIFGSPTNPLDCTFGTELSRIEFVRSGPLCESLCSSYIESHTTQASSSDSLPFLVYLILQHFSSTGEGFGLPSPPRD